MIAVALQLVGQLEVVRGVAFGGGSGGASHAGTPRLRVVLLGQIGQAHGRRLRRQHFARAKAEDTRAQELSVAAAEAPLAVGGLKQELGAQVGARGLVSLLRLDEGCRSRAALRRPWCSDSRPCGSRKVMKRRSRAPTTTVSCRRCSLRATRELDTGVILRDGGRIVGRGHERAGAACCAGRSASRQRAWPPSSAFSPSHLSMNGPQQRRDVARPRPRPGERASWSS